MRRYAALLVAGVFMVSASFVLAAEAEAEPPPLGSPKNPVAVPKAGEIKVDAKLTDWAKIKAMPMPFMKTKAGPMKLAWNETGLYGCLQVKDEKIVTDPASPWKGDCLEFWIEKDAAYAFDMGVNASQIIFVPDPESKTGDCLVIVAQGTDEGKDGKAGIVAKWAKTADGYIVEFLLPAKMLVLPKKPATEEKPDPTKEPEPVKLVAETKLGLNFAHNDGGEAKAQFYCDKNTDEAFQTPKLWGTVILEK